MYMALVAASYPYELSVRLGATNDKTVTKRFTLQADTHANALVEAGIILAALANVSAGAIAGYSINTVFIEDAYARPSSEDAEYGEEAILVGRIDGQPLKSYSLRIPFPRIGLFVAAAGRNRDIIDVNDTAVLAWVALFADGGQAYVSDGEFTEGVDNGRRL